MLSHTPPKFTPGSYDPPVFNKRARAGSISGRLRSASDLCDEGIITPQEKGIIKVRGAPGAVGWVWQCGVQQRGGGVVARAM